MKIALISPNYLPIAGGTQVVVHNIAKHLLGSGHDVVVITRRLPEERAVHCYDEVETRSFVEYGGKLSFIYTSLILYPFLKKHISHVDVIHQFHLLRFGLPVTLFGRRYRKPVITTLMGTDTFDPEYPYTRLFSPYLSRIMNNSSAVTSPSMDLSRDAYKQGCRQKIHVIPHGIHTGRYSINTQRVARLRKALLHDTAAQKIILSVGRLHSIKRVDIIIRAMSFLIDAYGVKNATVIFVGDGPEKDRLLQLTRDLRLTAFVKFVGHVPQEEIADYYHCCDIFAFHSTYETFGLVLAEAMACGKPVVSTLAGAIPEVVNHKETGLLVAPNDPESFAQALNALLSDEPAAKAMGEQGRRKALQRYEWRTICSQYLDLYNTVLHVGPRVRDE